MCREAREAAGRVLIVEDDPEVASLLEQTFSSRYVVRARPTADRALKELEAWGPDLVLLDLNLPGKSGSVFLSELNDRREAGSLAVIVVSAAPGEKAVLDSFRRGADDFVHKPFSGDELLSRAEAVLRRMKKTRTTLTVGPLTLDLRKRVAFEGTRESEAMSDREVDFLEALSRGAVGKAKALELAVEKPKAEGAYLALNAFIGRLRNKLPPSVRKTLIITTGNGYRLGP